MLPATPRPRTLSRRSSWGGEKGCRGRWKRGAGKEEGRIQTGISEEKKCWRERGRDGQNLRSLWNTGVLPFLHQHLEARLGFGGKVDGATMGCKGKLDPLAICDIRDNARSTKRKKSSSGHVLQCTERVQDHLGTRYVEQTPSLDRHFTWSRRNSASSS